MLSVSQCLDIMEQGQSFSFKCVTYNRQRKTGGEVLHLEEAKLVRKVTKGGRALTKAEAKEYEPEVTLKSPHHKKWYTRNLRMLINGEETSVIKKIHPALLIEFNGQKVTP